MVIKVRICPCGVVKVYPRKFPVRLYCRCCDAYFELNPLPDQTLEMNFTKFHGKPTHMVMPVKKKKEKEAQCEVVGTE